MKRVVNTLVKIIESGSNQSVSEIVSEQKFIDAGLVDVNTIDPSILVDLVNSNSSKNFFRMNFYDGLNKAYLHEEVALKLSKAQQILKNKMPGYSLLIMDAVRPNSVSWMMYESLINLSSYF